MAGSIAAHAGHRAYARPRRLTEPAAVRLLLTAIGLAFLALFLLLPLTVVFVEAFRNGIVPVEPVRPWSWGE